ncbi:MAG: hypothetical protein P8J59_11975 [Phycisphaerales bacterium]|jgi:hypothetical protein|nr:hypothetical protein [Phycisphaerales bacterium]
MSGSAMQSVLEAIVVSGTDAETPTSLWRTSRLVDARTRCSPIGHHDLRAFPRAVEVGLNNKNRHSDLV